MLWHIFFQIQNLFFWNHLIFFLRDFLFSQQHPFGNRIYWADFKTYLWSLFNFKANTFLLEPNGCIFTQCKSRQCTSKLVLAFFGQKLTDKNHIFLVVSYFAPLLRLMWKFMSHFGNIIALPILPFSSQKYLSLLTLRLQLTFAFGKM